MRYRNLPEIYSSCSFALTAVDPMTYEEAKMNLEWVDAMNKEMEAVCKNQTWELTTLHEGKKAIGLKWVFKSKFKPDGTLLKKKVRVVAKGYAQREGEDYDKIFSPIARIETIRLFMALGTQRRWRLYQLDVKTTFLNGELKEEVFVYQPEGFIISGEEDKVYKLRKSLYGLR